MTIHVICAAFNGEPFIGEFLGSLERQTVADWRLWVRDDGSTDRTADIVDEACARDPRVSLVRSDRGAPLGPMLSFGKLLIDLPAAAEYVMFADQDDVWLPTKIGRSLAAMRETERVTGGEAPILIHTDLTVVDHELRPLHPSFWRFSGFDPEPVSLRRLIAGNVAVGATCMINRALRDAACPIPPQAAMHDWWLACVAAAFGQVVCVREATVHYRQHAANAIGARAASDVSLRTLPALAAGALANGEEFRNDVNRSAVQAQAFLERYDDRLTAVDREWLARYAAIRRRGRWRRKLEVVRLRAQALPKQDIWRTIAALVRA